jgi:hypothetical protein
MVFQEHSAFRLWPFSLGSKSDVVAENEEEVHEARGFDLADAIERGAASEIVTEFMHPLRRSSKLWRFNVKRSEDKQHYRLFSEDGDFLMYARHSSSLGQRYVKFFLYDPTDKESFFDSTRPAFTMTCSRNQNNWRLVQERCEHCVYATPHRSCDLHGKQQVAAISHTQEFVGEGIFNEMDVNIPGLFSDGSRVVWCPCTGRGDLLQPPGECCAEFLRLCLKKPDWNEEVESLVLDFRGRRVVASAKNFQAVLSHKPHHVVCQYGKIGQNVFGLDLRYPLSLVQAFAIAMTTVSWT